MTFINPPFFNLLRQSGTYEKKLEHETRDSDKRVSQVNHRMEYDIIVYLSCILNERKAQDGKIQAARPIITVSQVPDKANARKGPKKKPILHSNGRTGHSSNFLVSGSRGKV